MEAREQGIDRLLAVKIRGVGDEMSKWCINISMTFEKIDAMVLQLMYVPSRYSLLDNR